MRENDDTTSSIARLPSNSGLQLVGTMGRHEDDSSSSSDSYRRDKKSKKHRKKKSRKERKKRRFSDDESSRTTSCSDQDDRRQRKHRKKEHKKDKSKSKRVKKRSREALDDSSSPSLERNVALADALCHLFQSHPDLVDDLPIMLIRMGGGATFDLSQMTNLHASSCLGDVFRALHPLGVAQDNGGVWQWTGPKNDLVLIRVIRAMLDQIGITDEAVEEYETRLAKDAQLLQERLVDESRRDSSKQMTKELLNEFRSEAQLTKELASLCSMILEGESIALDALPNEKLRSGLERLFECCRLEKSEMEQDSDDEDAIADSEAAMGYALPDADYDIAKSMLQAVIQVCREEELANNRGRRAIAGPMCTPEEYAGQNYQALVDESDDDDGPDPYGKHVNESGESSEMIKAAAEKRARDLEYAKTGIMPPTKADKTVREEWMVDPGKFDFLSNIKSGQPMRNRGFQAQEVAGSGSTKRKDPKIQAEIDAIMQAHEESRGPSLMELHKQKKAQEAEQASDAKSGGKWKWDREKDLDAGRRVDKANLSLVWGGAGTDLKQKFHKGT